MMDGEGQSDRPVVPTKSPNNAGRPVAEGMQGRDPAKENPSRQTVPRAQHRDGARSALERVRGVAERDNQVRFTTLLHHVYNCEHLNAAYYALKRDAAAWVDGETWGRYGEALEAHLADLSGRLKDGAYRARPVKRVYIPKADGRQPGIHTLEDKVVQRARADERLLLNCLSGGEVYEDDLLLVRRGADGIADGLEDLRRPSPQLLYPVACKSGVRCDDVM